MIPDFRSAALQIAVAAVACAFCGWIVAQGVRFIDLPPLPSTEQR